MPRGVVIAVKPMGSRNDSELLNAISAGSSLTDPYSAAHKPGAKLYIYFIKVDPATSPYRIAWFIDEKNKYKEKQPLEFDIDEGMTRPINGAMNIRRDKSWVPALPTSILPQLALLAAALLLIGVTVDKKH